jgi:hypothetical protein
MRACLQVGPTQQVRYSEIMVELLHRKLLIHFEVDLLQQEYSWQINA